VTARYRKGPFDRSVNASRRQAVFLARHDALTQLPNRVLFHERIEQAQVGRGAHAAVLCLSVYPGSFIGLT